MVLLQIDLKPALTGEPHGPLELEKLEYYTIRGNFVRGKTCMLPPQVKTCGGSHG